jgi:hypothetical protein
VYVKEPFASRVTVPFAGSPALIAVRLVESMSASLLSTPGAVSVSGVPSAVA